MADPYKTPISSPTLSGDRCMSLIRGIAWAIPLGACGFCAPFLALGVVLLMRMMFTDMLPFDRAAEFRELPINGISSAVVCSLMFAFSALANFSPCRGIGFIRSLLVMGVVVIVALFVTSVAILTLGIGPRLYTSDPYLWLRVTIFIVLLCAGGAT